MSFNWSVRAPHGSDDDCRPPPNHGCGQELGAETGQDRPTIGMFHETPGRAECSYDVSEGGGGGARLLDVSTKQRLADH